jgi:hypothetical protein
MGELRKKRYTHIGFIDPYIVYKNPITHASWLEDTRANIRNFLERQRDKKAILFPYNFK